MTRERNLSFLEREGLTPLPVAYELEELSYEVRNEIKYILDEELNKYFGYYRDGSELPDWHKMFKDWHVQFLKQPIEAFYPDNTRHQLLGLVSNYPYNQVFDVLEFFINHKILINHSFASEISNLFEREQVAYLLIERDKNYKIFVPRASKQEGEAYLSALASLSSDFFSGARKNLAEAGYHLAKKEYDKSVRESIHAVESIIRVLTNNRNIKYSDGMRELINKFSLHRALGEGFTKLYGFASDADGVRHSSIEGIETIDEETAFYFLGACASFVTFVMHKARKNQIREEQQKEQTNA
jgi:hypothetical protein